MDSKGPKLMGDDQLLSDKEAERQRYDSRALQLLERGDVYGKVIHGSQSLPSYLRQPYAVYESLAAELFGPDHRLLELGAGAGLHTVALVQTGAAVVATDISSRSLELLTETYRTHGSRLETSCADMESLPFEPACFDGVFSAGALSYGRPALVYAEVARVLRPGGYLVCVDSLNDNPVYRFNRWVHYLRGNRTASTLQHMPTLRSLQNLGPDFEVVRLECFGSLVWLAPFLLRLVGEPRTARWIEAFDRLIRVRRSAFRFVLVARRR